MTPYARILITAEEREERVTLGYSGRGMMGRTCVGVVTDEPEDVIAEVGLDGARIDSMGKSFIVYWPQVSAPSAEHKPA